MTQKGSVWHRHHAQPIQYWGYFCRHHCRSKMQTAVVLNHAMTFTYFMLMHNVLSLKWLREGRTLFRIVTKVRVEVMSMQTQPTGACLRNQLTGQMKKWSLFRVFFLYMKMMQCCGNFFDLIYLKKARCLLYFLKCLNMSLGYIYKYIPEKSVWITHDIKSGDVYRHR